MRLVPALLFCCLPATAASIWIECEQFENVGGWQRDTQFYDQMGSAYLLAQGLRGPCAEATTVIRLPSAGRRRAWVRTRDWVPEAEPAPGRFRLAVNGTESDVLGGDGRGEWHWQSAGELDLPAGEVTLALRDLTGWYGRADAILLCDNLGFVPPDELDGYLALRRELTGVIGDYELVGEYDVVVVGGGIAGGFAAVSAARHGARVVLIQDRPMLGGNASDEIHVLPQGASTHQGPFSREGGLCEEAWRAAVRLGSWSKALDAMAAAEANLTVLYGTRAVAVEMLGDRLTAVRCRDVLTSRPIKVAGRIFIDCTGDGTIGYLAGNEWRWGSEPRSMYQESRAPEVGDRQTMGASLLYRCAQADQDVAWQAPPWAHYVPDRESLHGREPNLDREGHWWIEWGGELDTIDDKEQIRDNLLRILYGVYDFLKNRSQYAQAARRFDLVWVGTVAGQRESRRLIGDYVLTQSDVEQAVLFEDRVAYGGWTIDLHPPAGFFAPTPPAVHTQIPPYSIPFRCLCARDVSNLMMAGRCISVSRVALGTTRVMLTCGTQGQAVGTAAALCLSHACTPRELGRGHIAELQHALLRDDAYLIDFPLREPDNLAQAAEVSASSWVASEPYRIENVKLGDRHELGHQRAARLPSPGGWLERVSVYVENGTAQPVPMAVQLRAAAADSDHPPVETLAEAQADAPPGGHWVVFEFARDVPADAALWFVLQPTPGIHLRLAANQPAGTARAYAAPGSSDWTPRAECYAVVTEPGILQIAGCEPAGATDGWTRPREGRYRGWIADSEAALPQWLELRWGTAQTVGRAEVVFDTDLSTPRPTTLVEKSVLLDYRLEAEVDGRWLPLIEVTDNVDRLRRHEFDPVRATALRLVALRTGGDAARLYELRAYPPG